MSKDKLEERTPGSVSLSGRGLGPERSELAGRNSQGGFHRRGVASLDGIEIGKNPEKDARQEVQGVSCTN